MFNLISTLFVVVIAFGWSWSIATARPVPGAGGADSTSLASTASAIAEAITEPNAAGTAFLTDAMLTAFDPLRGESGRLRARFAHEGDGIIRDTLPSGAVVTFSTGGRSEESARSEAPARPGIWKVALKVGSAIKPLTNFNVITLKPASAKRNGRIGLYYIGSWPAARGGAAAKGNYAPPSGFIEVTPRNQNTYVSDHFRLRDFLPKDQRDVWPKYLVLESKLLDKLELVMTDLQKRGVQTRGVRVMSGFRTPQYNSGVGDTRGRASLSRHMYGDASDIYIDNDGNGSMDDINRDGRVDIRDAEFIRSAVDRVERAHPSLIGGTGVYRATGAHGPFTHLDTRGYRARW